MFVFLCVLYMYVCLSIAMYVCLSVCLSDFLSVYLSARRFSFLKQAPIFEGSLLYLKVRSYMLIRI